MYANDSCLPCFLKFKINSTMNAVSFKESFEADGYSSFTGNDVLAAFAVFYLSYSHNFYVNPAMNLPGISLYSKSHSAERGCFDWERWNDDRQFWNISVDGDLIQPKILPQCSTSANDS